MYTWNWQKKKGRKMRRNISAKIALCGIFAALTCVCAMISIPFGPVPINMAHIAIFLSAWFLTPGLSFVSQLIYILLGIVGLPVFSGFSAGLGHVLGPTGGFIIAYPVVACLASYIFKMKKIKGAARIVLGLLIGWLVEYIVGTVYYSVVTSTSPMVALTVCVIPFVVGDVCKSFVIYITCKKIKAKSILTNIG